MPKRVKVVTLFIVCPLLLYFAGFLGTSAWNRVSIGYYFPIHASSNDQNASETCWEYPLEALITVPKNLHFHLYMENTSSLSGKVLCEPLFLTVYGSPDGTKVFYEEKIYPPGKGHVSRNYHWSINQNWERVYIKLSLPDGINTVQVKKAALAWDLSLNPSIISVVFNQIFLNSKWLLAYVLVSIITLRMFFLRYYPAQAYKKPKIDFSRCTPWILLIIVLFFQFYMIIHSAYPLYTHDYEILLRAINRIQNDSIYSFLSGFGTTTPPFPVYLLACFVWIFGCKWGYLLLIITRLGVIWSVWEISRQLYKDKTIAYTALLFASILPYNLYLSPMSDISGYDTRYWFDIGKIMAMTLLYVGIAIGFRIVNERKLFTFKILACFFCCIGIMAFLSRIEVIISYGLVGLTLLSLIGTVKGKYFLRTFLFIVVIGGMVGGLILFYFLKEAVTTRYSSNDSYYEVFRYIIVYFSNENNYGSWFVIACALFFRFLMLRFSLKILIFEITLLYVLTSTFFILYFHAFMYSRYIYVLPIQAILAGIGFSLMYQFFMQTFLLLNDMFSFKTRKVKLFPLNRPT